MPPCSFTPSSSASCAGPWQPPGSASSRSTTKTEPARPLATRVLEVLDPLARTSVLHRGQVLTVVAPALSPLQNELLSLLGTPLGPYGAEKSERPNSAQEPWSRCGT